MKTGPRITVPSLEGVLRSAITRRSHVRIYLQPQGAGDAQRDILEGTPVELASGRDGRARVRVQLPTGPGELEAVEVRVPLDRIVSVESDDTELVGATQPGENRRPPSRPTLEYAVRDSGIRAPVASEDSWDDVSGQSRTSAFKVPR